LLERARENASVANVEIDFREGDAEALSFNGAQFDIVLSQFGHMFAPRPEIAIAEMLRYMPPPPPGVSPPPQWGDVAIVRERLGAAVKLN
jgi:SAM-dependent methyltransferase